MSACGYGWPPILVMRLATEFTGLSKWTLARAVRIGKLRATGRCGRALTFERSELERYLRGDSPQAAPERAPLKRASTSTSALDRLAAIRKGAL